MSARGRARQWSAYIPFDFVSTYEISIASIELFVRKDCLAVILRPAAGGARGLCVLGYVWQLWLDFDPKRADLAIPEGSIRVLTTRTHGVATHAKL
jgi:hypothetical protein